MAQKPQKITNFKNKEKIKALVMFSGGLDSSLAVRILQEQGIEVEAAHFTSVFHTGKFDEYSSSARRFADRFGVKLTTFEIENDFIDILKNPRYGYGSNMNPCIDCRIYTLKKAKWHMPKTGASFIATGEVLGQRPMSQRKNMIEVIEKRSGLDGLLLRPLSAKLLKPTIPEEKGWVDREKLFDINGRSRKPQMALAKKYGIKDYPNPAGGCLLTDSQFSVKLRDLLKHHSLTMAEMEFLKVGRHFRLSQDTKAIVGRNRDDNARILELLGKGDVVVRLTGIPSPMTVVRGKATKEEIKIAGAITAKYTKASNQQEVKVTCSIHKAGKSETFSIKPAGGDDLKKFALEK